VLACPISHLEEAQTRSGRAFSLPARTRKICLGEVGKGLPFGAFVEVDRTTAAVPKQEAGSAVVLRS